MRMSSPDTKTRILDAAESLFARDGFHFASLRAITTEADVNLAAVNYHFGSKEVLLEEVLTRRLVPLNAIRMEKLEAVRQEAENAQRIPDPKDVLEAFIVPTVRFCCQDPGNENFSTLVARAIAEPDDTVRNVFILHIMPLFMAFFELLKMSRPDLDADTVFWRLHFALGSTTHMMRVLTKLELLPPGLNQDVDVDRLTAELIDFIAAGVER